MRSAEAEGPELLEVTTKVVSVDYRQQSSVLNGTVQFSSMKNRYGEKRNDHSSFMKREREREQKRQVGSKVRQFKKQR